LQQVVGVRYGFCDLHRAVPIPEDIECFAVGELFAAHQLEQLVAAHVENASVH
jgi:hypothetical protein